MNTNYSINTLNCLHLDVFGKRSTMCARTHSFSVFAKQISKNALPMELCGAQLVRYRFPHSGMVVFALALAMSPFLGLF